MEWTGIITALTALAATIFGFYQYGYNKKTDYKLEKQRHEDKRKYEVDKAKLSDIYGKLYAYMWKLTYSIDADRVYIIQPHPLRDKQFISISLEVTHPDRDVTAHKDHFQFKRMSDWAGLVAKIANDEMHERT